MAVTRYAVGSATVTDLDLSLRPCACSVTFVSLSRQVVHPHQSAQRHTWRRHSLLTGRPVERRRIPHTSNIDLCDPNKCESMCR